MRIINLLFLLMLISGEAKACISEETPCHYIRENYTNIEVVKPFIFTRFHLNPEVGNGLDGLKENEHYSNLFNKYLNHGQGGSYYKEVVSVLGQGITAAGKKPYKQGVKDYSSLWLYINVIEKHDISGKVVFNIEMSLEVVGSAHNKQGREVLYVADKLTRWDTFRHKYELPDAVLDSTNKIIEEWVDKVKAAKLYCSDANCKR